MTSATGTTPDGTTFRFITTRRQQPLAINHPQWYFLLYLISFVILRAASEKVETISAHEIRRRLEELDGTVLLFDLDVTSKQEYARISSSSRSLDEILGDDDNPTNEDENAEKDKNAEEDKNAEKDKDEDEDAKVYDEEEAEEEDDDITEWDEPKSEDLQRPPKKPWYDVEIPKLSDHVDKDSIVYDIIMGFFFAALLTFSLVIIGCCLNCCCTWLFCSNRRKKRRVRHRYKIEDSSYGMFIPMKEFHAYRSLPDEDSEEDEDKEDIDDDPDRLEYGEHGGEYDDEDDYALGAKKINRYEEKEVEQAAKEYFEKEEKATEQDCGDEDEKEPEHEDLLDLEAMDEKIAQSVEKAKFY